MQTPWQNQFGLGAISRSVQRREDRGTEGAVYLSFPLCHLDCVQYCATETTWLASKDFGAKYHKAHTLRLVRMRT